MNVFKFGLLVLLCGATAVPGNGQSPLPANTSDPQSLRRVRPPKSPEPIGPHVDTSIFITSPTAGQTFTGDTVNVTVWVGRRLDTQSFRVRLNGRNITAKFTITGCSANSCERQATLQKSDGLRAGENRLRAGAVAFVGAQKKIETKRVRFTYSQQLPGAPQEISKYLPSAIGLLLYTLNDDDWVTLTTGTPANLVDNIDTTKYSVPYRDIAYPSAGDLPCSQTYRVLVLDRNNPATEIAYKCFPDSPSLSTYLKTLDSTMLVIASTTPETPIATPQLDTTAIGGTNYSSTPSGSYPRSYAVIGVPGAAPNTAWESFDLFGDKPMPYSPWAAGMLVEDAFGNYAYHPGGNASFYVSPNDKSGKSMMSINGQQFSAPSWSNNGFWLLIVDRVTLVPMDASLGGGPLCPSGCGTFFNTGSTDAPTAANNIAALSEALTNVSNRTLAFLTTVETPFQNSNAVTAQLATAITLLGGSRYTLPKLTTATSTYTLIAPGAVNNQPWMQFAPGIVSSSSAYSQQGQTGFVRGVLARQRNNLYGVTSSFQSDGALNQSTTIIDPDTSFYEISSQLPGDWPLTDTSGHIAAYHYASQEFLNWKYQETGSHSQDIRYFYAEKPDMGTFNTYFQTSPDYPGDGQGFTATDLADAKQQLYLELTALSGTYDNLGPNGLQSLFQNEDNSLAGSIMSATTQVLSGGVGATPNSNVGMNLSGWLNLAAGLASIPGALLGPADLPLAAAAFGTASGLLWTGSAIQSPFGSQDPPSYENVFDTTLGNMQANADNYAQNVIDSYAATLDIIYSDWGKLSAIGDKTEDSDSGWDFQDALKLELVSDVMGNGTQRSIYLQLLPQFFQLDTYPGVQVNDVTKLGMYWYLQSDVRDEYGESCTASYSPSPTSPGFAIYNQIGNTSTHDIFVIGGTITNQGTENVKEAMPSSGLVDMLFGKSNLNIPPDMVYSSNQTSGGFMTYRGGPVQKNGYCYAAPCSKTTVGTYPAGRSCLGA